MKQLLQEIQTVKNNPEIKKTISSRLKEFEEFGKNDDKVFSELCFCITTANFDAERSIKIQNEIGKGFESLTEKQLAKKLKELGYRFPNIRAKFIVESRKHKPVLPQILSNGKTDAELREWFVANVKGFSYKEASHFLRNIGFKDLAIIDFHIVDVLAKHNLIEKPKTMNKAKYFEIESLLKEIGKKTDMNMAELDLYLWYLETGKILK